MVEFWLLLLAWGGRDGTKGLVWEPREPARTSPLLSAPSQVLALGWGTVQHTGSHGTALGRPSPPFQGVLRPQLGGRQGKAGSERLSRPANCSLSSSNWSQPHRQRKASQPSQLANITFFLLRKSKISSIKAYLKYHSTFVWVHCYSSTVWLMDPWSKWVLAAVERYFCPTVTSCAPECADRSNQIFNCVLSKVNRKGIQWPVNTFPEENTHFLLKKKIQRISSPWNYVIKNGCKRGLQMIYSISQYLGDE